MVKRSVVRLFESRKGNLDYRIKRDYIRNGIARIPCRISDYSEVMSTYSVKNFETLNPEFVEYVRSTAALTPPECPVVLQNVMFERFLDRLSKSGYRGIREQLGNI